MRHLGDALGCVGFEGDSFHGEANVAKMRAGHPLDDEDRWPWLDRLGTAIGEAARSDGIAVAACSALKRVYRERLETAAGLPLHFVLLDTGAAEIERRMESRAGHYMPSSLLASQIATLERPGPDERAITLDASRAPDDLSVAVLDWVEGVSA